MIIIVWLVLFGLVQAAMNPEEKAIARVIGGNKVFDMSIFITIFKKNNFFNLIRVNI